VLILLSVSRMPSLHATSSDARFWRLEIQSSRKDKGRGEQRFSVRARQTDKNGGTREFAPPFRFCGASNLEIEAQGELHDAGWFLPGQVGDLAEG